MPNKRHIIINYILCAAILLFCECFFFRNIIGTDKMFGDDADGRLTMLVAEHWFHVFNGKAPVSELGMFYPAENTLAYSDMLLGYGVIHSIFRFMDMDIFSAYRTTLVLIHILGTFALFYLLKRCMRVNFTWSLFGTITFSFTSTYAIHIYHTQLVAISILPFVIIFASGFFNNIKNRLKRNFYAVLIIASYVLILYTSWYMAFFSVLFTATLLIVGFFTAGRKKSVTLLKSFKNNIPVADVIFYILLAAVLIAPFIILYIPVLKMSGGGFSFTFLGYTPEIIDIINVSENNLLLGSLIKAAKLSKRGYSFEVIEGFSIVLLVIFIYLSFYINKLFKDHNDRLYLLCKAIIISILISIILVIRISGNGISLWVIIHFLVPGAKAIRAIARYFFFLSLPMSIITAVMGCKFSIAKKLPAWTTCVLVLMAFIANIHIGGVSASWSMNKSSAFINSISAPPDNCKVFYIINPAEPSRGEPWIQLDAWQIADRFNIKTINGYSGVFPKGWGNVSDWIVSNGLKNIYAYDETNNIWIEDSSGKI